MFKKDSIDIVIPLSSGSKHDNFELRMALRSIARHVKNCGQIRVITDSPPAWLDNCQVLSCPDKYLHNKDANIIRKLLTAANETDLSDQFLFWSDDQVALRSFNASSLPPIFNRRSAEAFHPDRIWHRRMLHTFEYLQKHDLPLNCNWESHTPQRIDKALFQQLLKNVDYITEPGLAVNTIYFGLAGICSGMEQSCIKLTVEKPLKLGKLPDNKLFIGYNDNAWQGDLPQLLMEKFPRPCCYERT